MTFTPEEIGELRPEPPEAWCLGARCAPACFALVVVGCVPAAAVPAGPVPVLPAAVAAPGPGVPVGAVAPEPCDALPWLATLSFSDGMFRSGMFVLPLLGDVVPAGVGVDVGCVIGSAGVDATLLVGADVATDGWVTADVARVKLVLVPEEVEGSAAGTTPVVPVVVVHRPWHGVVVVPVVVVAVVEVAAGAAVLVVVVPVVVVPVVVVPVVVVPVVVVPVVVVPVVVVPVVAVSVVVVPAVVSVRIGVPSGFVPVAALSVALSAPLLESLVVGVVVAGAVVVAAAVVVVAEVAVVAGVVVAAGVGAGVAAGVEVTAALTAVALGVIASTSCAGVR